MNEYSVKYSKLEPKDSNMSLAPTTHSILQHSSNLQISKDWQLPDRLKPGRKPIVKNELSEEIKLHCRGSGTSRSNSDCSSTSSTSSLSSNSDDNMANISSSISSSANHTSSGSGMINDNCNNNNAMTVHNITHAGANNDMAMGATSPQSPCEGNKVDSVARRRKQNRDAQRAYRERKANRIQVLEKNVNYLKSLVADWENKYNNLKISYDENNIKLTSALEQISYLKDLNNTTRNTTSASNTPILPTASITQPIKKIDVSSIIDSNENCDTDKTYLRIKKHMTPIPSTTSFASTTITSSLSSSNTKSNQSKLLQLLDQIPRNSI